MSVLTEPVSPIDVAPGDLIGSAPPSPAGPADGLRGLSAPPSVRRPRPVQVLWFGQRQASSCFATGANSVTSGAARATYAAIRW